MACYYRGYEEESIRRTLRRNIGKVCTVFTESGGRAGEGFTGLVVDVTDYDCKIITAFPSIRRLRPFGRTPFDEIGGFRDCGCGRRRREIDDVQGTYCTIPMDKITCVSTPEI